MRRNHLHWSVSCVPLSHLCVNDRQWLGSVEGGKEEHHKTWEEEVLKMLGT